MGVLDGKQQALLVRKKVSDTIEELLKTAPRPPGLCTILVGDDAASTVYVRNKRNAAAACGIVSYHHQLPASCSQEELLALLDQLNEDPSIDGILVQLPLPAHIDSALVINAINPLKDVDGFHPFNVGLLALGTPRFVPCTPKGCLHLIQSVLPSLKGLHAVVVGRSNIVGKPMAQLLLQQNATVTICHRYTEHLDTLTKQADVLVVAAGQPHLIKAHHVKPQSTVIDVGITRNEDGKLIGDVDFNDVKDKVKYITPVPGGVGPMTIAMLLENTLLAYQGFLS